MIFDFRQWRIDRRLTQKEAGALLGASSGFWGDMESGKSKPHKQLAVVRVLSYYNQHWGRLCATVKQLSPELIGEFIEAQKAKDPKITLKEISNACGLAKSTLGNLARGNNDFSTVGTQVKFMICAYMLKCSGVIPESIMEQVNEEELVTVTVPATAELPERTFTPDDVVVTVGEPAVVPQATQDDFERIEYILIDGAPMWRLVDVCRAIDYKNPSDAKKLVRSSDIEKSTTTNSSGQMVEQWLVNEYGLLRILAKANTPKTEPFERWVFEEVLPAIRKNGSYQVGAPANPIDAMILSLQELKQVQAKQAKMESEIKQLRESTVTADQVAQIAVVKSKEAQAKHRSDLYYIDKHVKSAAREITLKIHGERTKENFEVWNAYHGSKIKGINRVIRDAVAKNYACHPKQAPGRDRYSEADKRTAYAALNRWREFNGLQTQLALSLEA